MRDVPSASGDDAAIPKIQPLLRIMKNQTSNNVNGGGWPLKPMPPRIDPNVCRRKARSKLLPRAPKLLHTSRSTNSPLLMRPKGTAFLLSKPGHLSRSYEQCAAREHDGSTWFGDFSKQNQ